MSSFSDYTEAAVLNHLYGSTTFNKPGKFLALFSAAPSDAGGGTELSAAGGYARLALPNMTVSGTNPTLATNGAVIEWPAATAAWSAPVTHIAVFDASSGGNMLAWTPLVVSRTVNTGEVFRVSAGDLDITVDTFAASGSVAGASNLLKYSEQFNAEAWRTTLPSGQPSVVANVSADAQGRQTVDELTPNFAAQSPYVRQHVTGLVVGQTYTFSVELQQGRVNSKLAARLTTNNTLAWNTGASTKAPLTSSLVRHSVTWTQQGSTTAAIMIGATDSAGAGDADCEGPIRLANAMLNVGSTAAPYVRTGEADGAANLLTYSEQFNAEAWRTTLPSGQPSVVANVSADAQGRQTVDELTPNFAAQSPYVRQHVTGLVVGQTYTFSVELQQGRVNSKLAARLTTNNTLAWSTGASTKAPLTGSLVRHSVTWTQQGSTTAAIMIGATDAAGAGDADCEGPIRMANAMLNVGSSPAPYIRTGESEAANLLTYSEQFNATAWQAQVDSSQLIIAANVSADAQGNQTVDELTAQQAGSIYVRQHVTGLTIGQTYTFSLELQAGRSGSAQNARLTVNNTAAWNTGPSVAYPLTGTLTRRSITWTQQGTTTAALMVGCVDAAGDADGTCQGTIRMNDAMMNVGAVAAPYIRTGEVDTAPAPAPQPASTWPAKLFGAYAEIYIGTPPPYPDLDTLPQQYNLLYFFNLGFASNGAPVLPDEHLRNIGGAAAVQNCRQRGQKVMLTIGGAGRPFVYQTRAEADAAVNAIEQIYGRVGGFDGLDFNNFEAQALDGKDPDAFLKESRYIADQLRATYGPNFWISCPAQPNDPRQQAFCRDMIASGSMQFCNPQFYDASVFKDVNYISDRVLNVWIPQICGNDPTKIIVGFGGDYWSPFARREDLYGGPDAPNRAEQPDGGPNIADCKREYERIKAARPNILGMFGWSMETIMGYGVREEPRGSGKFWDISRTTTSDFNRWGRIMHPIL